MAVIMNGNNLFDILTFNLEAAEPSGYAPVAEGIFCPLFSSLQYLRGLHGYTFLQPVRAIAGQAWP